MQHLHVPNLDLRSLALLASLLETRSITRTGDAFGLSQPAASRAVAQLRRALGDPLLVRTSKGYVLTPRAATLGPRLATLRRDLDALFAPDHFDAACTNRIFRIATTDYGAHVVLADAAGNVAREAPGATIAISPWSADTPRLLEDGVLDAALYPEAPLPPDFHVKRLFEDDYVLVVDAPETAKLDRADVLARRRVVMLYPSASGLAEDDILAEYGALPANVSLKTPYFTSAIWALPGTELVLALPRRVAERLSGPFGLRLLPLPEESPRFTYQLIWHENRQADPGHRWLRGLIR